MKENEGIQDKVLDKTRNDGKGRRPQCEPYALLKGG